MRKKFSRKIIKKFSSNIKILKVSVFIIALVIIFVLASRIVNRSVDQSLTDEEYFKIREAAVAGSWYPGTASGVKEAVKGYLDNVVDLNLNKTRAIIVPHAGWRFSGQVAATAFKQLKYQYRTIILIGPTHTLNFGGASIPNATHYQTPIGNIKISEKARKLLQEPLFQSHPNAHKKEHCLEIEMPFLQSVQTDFEIIPILIGSASKEDIKSIASILKKYSDDDTLIVISTDFTHYGPNYGYMPFTDNVSENLKKLDGGAVERIVAIDPEGFTDYCATTGATICGRRAVALLLYLLEDEEVTAIPLYYDTSGHMTNDYTNSVSYVTIAFTTNEKVTDKQTTSDPLTKQEQEVLLNLARDKLESLYYDKTKESYVYEITPNMKKVQGCFTTLTKNRQLRGCIGHILPQEELYECISENIENAALHDSRFSPVTKDELDDIEIEISVLSVPEKLSFTSGDDLKSKLRPMIDGVVLKKGFHQSTYLPQVWEQLPDHETFLSQLCIKGGMSRDCWQDTSTEVLTYQAFVFHESE